MANGGAGFVVYIDPEAEVIFLAILCSLAWLVREVCDFGWAVA
jgi:hypothetical protein